MRRPTSFLRVAWLIGWVWLLLVGCGPEKTDPGTVDGQSLPDLRTLWRDDPLQSERAFLEVKPAAEKSGDKAYQAELLTHLARAQAVQGRILDAHRSLDQAAELITLSMVGPKLRYLLERGRVFTSVDQADMAKPLFVEAYELAVKNGQDMAAIDAAQMMGLIEKGPAIAQWYEKALTLAEQSSDPAAEAWQGSLYHNLG